MKIYTFEDLRGRPDRQTAEEASDNQERFVYFFEGDKQRPVNDSIEEMLSRDPSEIRIYSHNGKRPSRTPVSESGLQKYPDPDGALIMTYTIPADNTTTSLPIDQFNDTVTYDFTVDWGDGTENTITSYNQPEIEHTYATAGTYTIAIHGTMGGVHCVGMV